MRMPSLYERLGGEAAVNAAVDRFYTKILSDPLLQPFFAALDMSAQIRKQKQFLTTAFGGPAHYTGRGLRHAHRNAVSRGLNDTHFDRVMQHLGATLSELSVPEALIREAAAIAESTRNDVLGRYTQ